MQTNFEAQKQYYFKTGRFDHNKGALTKEEATAISKARMDMIERKIRESFQ